MIRFAAYLFSSQILVIALVVITDAIINRTLGPAARGDYAELLSWYLIFSASFGLSIGVSIYHYADKKYGYTKGEILGSMISLWFVACLIGFVFIILILAVAPDYFSTTFKKSLIGVLFLVFGNMAVTYIYSLLTVAKAFRYLSFLLVTNALSILLIVYTLFVYSFLDTVNIIYAILGVQYLIITMFCIYLFYNRKNWFPLIFNISLPKKILFSGLKLHIATVATLLYVKFDQLMLYNISDREETGLYAVAATIAIGLAVFPTSIQKVLFNKMLESDSEYASDVSIFVAKITFYLFALLLIIFYLVSDVIISIYAGAQYSGAIPILNTILIGVLFFSIPSLLSPYWVKEGFFIFASLSAVALLALNLGLNYLWIPKFGGYGAAWATNVTYFSGMLISLLMFWYISRKNPFLIFLIRYNDIKRVCNLVRTAYTPGK